MEGNEFKTNNYQEPEKSELEIQLAQEWEQYGGFVPKELVNDANEIFNMIGKNPVFFEDMSDEDKTKYVEKLTEYSQVPDGPNAVKKSQMYEQKYLSYFDSNDVD